MIKIMVVEDDISIRTTLSEYLRLSGYDVEEYSNGRLALKVWENSKPDLIIVDLHQSEMSGPELISRMRHQDSTVLILMLSCSGSEEYLLRAYTAGADDCIVKPFSYQVLLKKIEIIMRRCGKSNSGELVYGKVRINTKAHIAYWEGVPLELTLTEFGLLHTMTSHHGQILSRSQLLDQVWGFNYIGEERIVDAHIKNLRHKLPENIVVTVQGVGYCIP
ncbi:MAG: response regulator transcription factor [Firmicutes bacterium]|nr:response regulator transcription factor [Bacillota bacterium]